MSFHVYVDGPIERTTDGIQRLAEAMCQRYGLRASDVVTRLNRGRFRVKANLDRTSADAYALDLEKIGARVVIEEARDSQPIAPMRGDAVSLPPPNHRPTPMPDRPSSPALGEAAPDPAPASRATPPGGRVVVTKPPGRPYAFSTPPTGTPVTGTTARGATPSSRPAEGNYGPIVGDRARTATPPRGDARTSTPPHGAATSARTSTPLPRTDPGPRGDARTSTPPHGAATSAWTTSPNDATSAPHGELASADPRVATVLGVGPTAAHGRAVTPAARIATPPSGSPAFTSGLAAAYGDQAAAPNLGALDASSLSLASVDGLDTGAPLSVAAFEPVAATARPAPTADKKERPKDVPLDLFAPPDIGEQELVVELAADELAHQARKRASTPVPVIDATAAAARPSSPMLQRKSQPSLPRAELALVSRHAAVPRWRLAAGVAVAIVLGFVPAHVVAASRERSAFRAIDAQVEQTQAAATTPDAYAKLDAFRADQLDRKRSARRSIALTSMLLWAALAGGLGYVWFRRVPWDRFVPR